MNVRPFPRQTDLTEDRARLNVRDAQQIQFSAVAAAAGVAAFRTACERARESGLDNNARTGYRETVAAKPRSGSRRCLN